MDENRTNEPAAAEAVPARRTSGMAIASLVLSLTCIGALPGLILGIVALVQIGRDRQRIGGEGLAIAGTVLSGIGVLAAPVFMAILFPVFARARDRAMQTTCLNNVMRLSTAMAMYQTDWNDTYPIAPNWNEALAKYARPIGPSSSASPWVCPAAKDRNVPSYAMNNKLSGLSAGVISSPADIVAIYECKPGKDQAGGPDLLPSPPRHQDTDIVGFADGHVKVVEQSSVSRLIWDPAAQAPSDAETEAAPGK